MAELVGELTEQLEGRPAPRLQREAALQRRRSSRVTRPRLPPGTPPHSEPNLGSCSTYGILCAGSKMACCLRATAVEHWVCTDRASCSCIL
jgi:hypothetical protein